METGIAVGLIIFLVGIFIGLPLAWVFLTSTVAALLVLGLPLIFIGGTFYHAIDSYVLMSIAFFLLAGNMMAISGIADRLTNLAYALVGRVRGGLVSVGILATVFMGALTGSALPCIAALVPTLVPRLESYGYNRAYVTAVLCSSSFLGYLIPPSVPALIYCLVAQQSVAAVFLSTVGPGLLLAIGYMAVNTIIVSKYYEPTDDIPELPDTCVESVKMIGSSFWKALPALGMPVMVMVGIYAGICTPNEAGALAVIYTAVVGLFVYRKMSLRSMLTCSLGTVGTLGMITLLLGFGTVFTRLLIREGAGEDLTNFVLSLSHDKFVILFAINILLLFFGMFIDGVPILIIMVPLLMPMAIGIDVNLVQLGAIIIINVGLGVVSPPYAVSIFVGSRMANVPYVDLVKPMLLFMLVVGIPVLLLTTFWPPLSLWLPTAVLGQGIVGPW